MSQQINLYEARLRPRHELATARNLGACALLMLVLMTALALWTRADADRKTGAAELVRKQSAEEQEKMVALAKMLAERKVSPALTSEIDVSKAMVAARSEVMTALDSGGLGNTAGFSGYMFGFARQAQSDPWLTGFAVTSGGEEIEISGRLLDPSRLPPYVQRLRGEPVFQGRRFAALEMRDVEPVAPKTDQPGAAKESGSNEQAQLKLPRYVEFVLRSENAGGADATKRSGAKP